MTASKEESAESRIQQWVQANRRNVEQHLLDLVGIETPTENPETFDRFFDRFAEDLRDGGLRTDRIPGDETGGRLEAWSPGADSADEIQLVIGHADTVWPLGTTEENPPESDGEVIGGPGSLDMKGGLTQLVFALRAIEDLSLTPSVPVYVLVSSDEEIGSPESKGRIADLAKRANRVFVLEPASGPEGKIKIARKAVGHFTVHIEGKAAHAGLEPEEGASATQELSSVIHRLHELTDVESGITVNVGEVEAGIRSNVVAPDARAEVDVRAPTEAAAEAVESRIRSLEATTPGTELAIDGGFGRPPMELTAGNRLLWNRVREIGQRLDLALEGTRSGGASDGNDASQHAPTIDGFGAVGDGAHQTYEHVRLDALVDRVALLAACLLDEPLPAEPRQELDDDHDDGDSEDARK
ncbi:M20 family metallopeptidase [Natronomonas sp.]|uniref:M20 family metallopeptidase n=1 Tax=Natronomonas sp. TaxID=2184060 RepID=UPI002FC38FBF